MCAIVGLSISDRQDADAACGSTEWRIFTADSLSLSLCRESLEKGPMNAKCDGHIA